MDQQSEVEKRGAYVHEPFAHGTTKSQSNGKQIQETKLQVAKSSHIDCGDDQKGKETVESKELKLEILSKPPHNEIPSLLKKTNQITSENQNESVHMWRHALKTLTLSSRMQPPRIVEGLSSGNISLSDGTNNVSIQKKKTLPVNQTMKGQKIINAPHVWQHIQKKQEEHRMQISIIDRNLPKKLVNHGDALTKNSDMKVLSVPGTSKKDLDTNSEGKSYCKERQGYIGRGSHTLHTRKIWKDDMSKHNEFQRSALEVSMSQINNEQDNELFAKSS